MNNAENVERGIARIKNRGRLHEPTYLQQLSFPNLPHYLILPPIPQILGDIFPFCPTLPVPLAK